MNDSPIADAMIAYAADTAAQLLVSPGSRVEMDQQEMITALHVRLVRWAIDEHGATLLEAERSADRFVVRWQAWLASAGAVVRDI